jgi:hypothetical protein
MPVDSILRDSAFGPEVVTVLASALDSAWETVKVLGSPFATDGNATSTRELLAKRIIKMARQGERDRKRLTDDAIAYLQGLESRG